MISLPRLAPLALAGSLLCTPLALQAASYEQLLQQLAATPQSQQWQLQQAQADTALAQAALRDNPTLSVQADGVYGSDDYRGRDQAEYSWQLTQPLDVWGERRLRIQGAQAAAVQLTAARQQADWQQAAELAAHFAALELAQKHWALAQIGADLAQADYRAITQAVAAGREAQLRALEASAELSQLRAQLPPLQAEIDIARAQLRQLLPEPATFTELHGSLLERELPVAAAASTLWRQRADAARQQAQSQLQQQRAASKPQLRLTAGSTRYAAEQDQALLFGVEMTLPVFDRGQARRQSAALEVEMAELALLQAQRAQETALLTAEARASAALQRVQALQHSRADLQRAYALSQQGYRAGRLSALELRAARARLIELDIQLLRAQQARVDAEITRAPLQARAPFMPAAAGVQP